MLSVIEHTEQRTSTQTNLTEGNELRVIEQWEGDNETKKVVLNLFTDESIDSLCKIICLHQLSNQKSRHATQIYTEAS